MPNINGIINKSNIAKLSKEKNKVIAKCNCRDKVRCPLEAMYSYGSPHTAAQKQDDQHERTFSSYVRIQVVVLKTYLGR